MTSPPTGAPSDAASAATSPFRAGTFVGRPVRRLEDARLLTGQASYIPNMDIAGVAELFFVRSPVPHGRIVSIDTEEAASFPGVAGVFTAADLQLPGAAGPANEHCVRHPLASDRVRFVGEPVAVIAADTRAQAFDAGEAVFVDYEQLPAVAGAEQALQPGAPILFESIGSNRVNGLLSDLDALEGADVVVRGRFHNQRLAVVPMEGGVVAVIPDTESPDFDLVIYAGVQMPHQAWATAARESGVPQDRIRMIAPDLGGAFGGKTWGVEHQIAVAVARTLGRPTRWVDTRSENMVSMGHGRSQIQYVEMGLRRDGTITGMRTRIIGDCGAYGAIGGLMPIASTRNVGQGPYAIPRIAWNAAIAVTNTTSTGAYRGAGRPEGAAQLERILDLAAYEIGLDPAAIRRRNYLRPEEFPLTTQTGAHYDSGNYEGALDEALRLAGYDELRRRQAELISDGSTRLLGVGIGSYIEASAPAIADFGSEFAAIKVHDDGTATLRVGTSGHGQGHQTSFVMVAADQLGIPMEDIRFVQADTALVPRGGGTVGSRSGQLAGSAVFEAALLLLEQARKLTAEHFEAAPDDIAIVGPGRLGVVGSPTHSLTWTEIARVADEQQVELGVEHVFDQGSASYPFGTHVSVVEVDIETGYVELLRHIAVDDCGVQINPMIVEGQVHGGIASGVAQALYEHFEYDDEGIPLTATLMDYKMPSAADLPSFETGNTVTPSPLNPLGAKGVGESGATGATGAVQNAVVNALAHLGVRHIELPCTPERVWRAVQDTRRGESGISWRDPSDVFAPPAEPQP